MTIVKLIQTPGSERNYDQEIKIDMRRNGAARFEFSSFEDCPAWEDQYSFDGFQFLRNGEVIYEENWHPFRIPAAGGSIEIILGTAFRRSWRAARKALREGIA